MFCFDFKLKNPNMSSPLTLAFVGDAIWEIYVRSRIIEEYPDMPVNKLHRNAVKFVKADRQCIALKALMDILSENEMSAYKRGRNANPHTVAKHASVSDYRHATGFEALLGYVYMKNNAERLNDLMEKAYNAVIETAE